ncbi:hypothetical protein [Bradyrhizobium iriomotense]|uniref:Uncharacterized protein n=1 Tax=Bradyrhizobium iriomotense TaxID=441950 RepID=A0ABQ6AND8_9BRAD|nr:hypothetical protein [Bradyrhizobium iriomotense]GLR83773.1 hypothetical protein GCM10007857_04830 [Bradyrhizobium iriomotense]
MTFDWKIARRAVRTRAARSEVEVLLMRYGKIIRRRWVRVAKLAVKTALELDGEVIRVMSAIDERAGELYVKFIKKYPFIGKLSRQEWNEAIARLINRGNKEDVKAIRGVIVERFVQGMDEFAKLYDEMAVLAAKTKGWQKPEIVSGVRTPNGRELADWMIVSQHPDGRIWIMAIVESKSISNTKDLVEHKGADFGQHLWDIYRALGEGMDVERTTSGQVTKTRYLPPNVVGGVPSATSSGFGTRFIAVKPRDFTTGELNRLGVQGIRIEQWPWPVDERRMLDLVNDLLGELGP